MDRWEKPLDLTVAPYYRLETSISDPLWPSYSSMKSLHDGPILSLKTAKNHLARTLKSILLCKLMNHKLWQLRQWIFIQLLVFDPEYARALPDLENAQPPLSNPQLTCEAGLWQTCCPLKYWVPKTEELNELSDSECKSLISIGTLYEPVFSGIDDFYIFQIWPIRCAMLIAVVMPFVAVISGQFLQGWRC